MNDLAQQEQELIALLQEHTSLGNGKARQLLGWEEATYAQVKQALVAKGQVAIGRGRGGSISLVAEGQGAWAAQRSSGAPVASTHRVDPQAEAAALATAKWSTLIERSKLQAHHEHQYEKELVCKEPVSHVRLNIFPDGGVSRIRLWGTIV